MTNKHFVVVDLETLAMYDDAIILSMGLCFGVYGEQKGLQKYVETGEHHKFDVIEQAKTFQRAIDQGTLDWWKSQNHEAKQNALVPNPVHDVSIIKLPDILTAFAKKNGFSLFDVDFYDRNSFDIKKIAHVIEVNLGKKIPWSYRNVVEITSFLKGMGYDRYAGINHEDFQPDVIIHNALHDAAVDAWRLEHTINTALGV